MKGKISAVAIPFLALLCVCDARERIELPQHKEGEEPGRCLAFSSLFPDELVAQIQMEFCFGENCTITHHNAP